MAGRLQVTIDSDAAMLTRFEPGQAITDARATVTTDADGSISIVVPAGCVTQEDKACRYTLIDSL